MKRIVVFLFMVCLVFSVGCSNKNTVGGALLGGVGGGLAGAQIGAGSGNVAAIIGGTIAGAALGSYVGSYLDRMDRGDKKNLNATLENTPSGQTQSWSNPDTNTAYKVTPAKTYQTDQGKYCREYSTEVKVGGKTENAYGKACRMEDGAWKIIS